MTLLIMLNLLRVLANGKALPMGRNRITNF